MIASAEPCMSSVAAMSFSKSAPLSAHRHQPKGGISADPASHRVVCDACGPRSSVVADFVDEQRAGANSVGPARELPRLRRSARSDDDGASGKTCLLVRLHDEPGFVERHLIDGCPDHVW